MGISKDCCEFCGTSLSYVEDGGTFLGKSICKVCLADVASLLESDVELSKLNGKYATYNFTKVVSFIIGVISLCLAIDLENIWCLVVFVVSGITCIASSILKSLYGRRIGKTLLKKLVK